MPALTDIMETEIEYDEFNSALLLITLFTIAAMGLFGLRTNDFSFFGIAATLTPMMLIGLVTLRKRLFTGPATLYQTVAGYWGFMTLARVMGLLNEGQFSFYSSASQTYLSTALSNAPDKAKALVNAQLIPYIENTLIFGEIVVSYKILSASRPLRFLPGQIEKVSYFAISATIGGLTFMRLHGVNPGSFDFKAFVLALLLASLLIGSDIGLFSFPLVTVTMGALFGFHKGLNIANLGGFFEFYGFLLSFAPPTSFFALTILVFDAVTLIYLVVGTVERILS